MEVLQGGAYLLAPLRSEVLQSLDAIHRPLALSRGHSFDLLQAIEQLLPSLLRKPVEPWFGRKRLLLVRGRKLFMPLQPLTEMWLIIFKSGTRSLVN